MRRRENYSYLSTCGCLKDFNPSRLTRSFFFRPPERLQRSVDDKPISSSRPQRGHCCVNDFIHLSSFLINVYLYSSTALQKLFSFFLIKMFKNFGGDFFFIYRQEIVIVEWSDTICSAAIRDATYLNINDENIF